MSLSVLVGQDTRMEGEGKNRHRVFIPPSPETLQKIKDLVAGITGFSQERGDQLIVETLPFESNYETDVAYNNLQTPKTAPSNDPPWMQVLNRYRNQIIGVLVGLAILSIVLRFIGVRRREGKEARDSEISREIERAAYQPLQQPFETAAVAGAGGGAASLTSAESAVEAATEASAGAKALLTETQLEATDRIRELAQRDMTATANVLRMWLDQKS
jgi:flagellar biosynthesis/type III secretory pathway M-ring protein FliF/YscJ